MLSDDPAASKKIKQFGESEDRWMVAVRMVSEGVDIPRLAVGVYATSTSTPLFFAQAVGRFVRARRRGETASVFLPSVPTLMGHAAEMETERDHVLDRPRREDGLDDDLLAEANRAARQARRRARRCRSRPSRRRRSSTGCVFDGGEFGMGAAPGSAEEEDFLGIPGLLEPDQVDEPAEAAPGRADRRPAQGRRARRAPTTAPPPRTSTPCARSSTAWSAPGTTAPASPTA